MLGLPTDWRGLAVTKTEEDGQTLNIFHLSPGQLALVVRNCQINAKLRKLFDASKSIFSIPCYEDDARSIMNLVQSFIQSSNLTLGPED